MFFFFFFQAEDGIRDRDVTGVQTCALPISILRSNVSASLSTPNEESFATQSRAQRRRGDRRRPVTSAEECRKWVPTRRSASVRGLSPSLLEPAVWRS